jgi:4-nitrophenyl phosphatase
MIQTEAADGKVFVGGFDNDGRPIIVLRSANEKTFDNKGKKCGNLVNLVYNIERAVASIETRRGSVPDDKWTLLLDFNGYSLFNAPPFETTKWTIKIVQDFYPERLHVAIMVDAPTLFWGAWKAASPFIDEVTKSKVVWISGPLESQERLDALREYVPLDQIDRSIGGSQPESLDYNAERYLAADPLRRTRTAT